MNKIEKINSGTSKFQKVCGNKLQKTQNSIETKPIKT